MPGEKRKNGQKSCFSDLFPSCEQMAGLIERQVMVAWSSHRSISFNLHVIHLSFVLTFVTKFGSGRSILRNLGDQVYESIVQRRVGCHPALWLQREREKHIETSHLWDEQTNLNDIQNVVMRHAVQSSSRGSTTCTDEPIPDKLRTGWHATRVSRFQVHSVFFESVELKKDYGRGTAFQRDERVRSYT